MSEINDTRDLVERKQELMLEAEEIENKIEADEVAKDDSLRLDLDEINEEIAEIDAIENAGIPDFIHGAAMIEEDDFEDYARQYAEDIHGDMDGAWPFGYIDWEKAAESLASDYTTVEYQGTTYLVRA